MASVTKKTVLITGCTTGGIGWAMAKVFHARGYYVFATVRGGHPSKAEGLSELNDVEILDVDVTDADTIRQAKDVVAKRTGGRLDVLMNNAGAEFVCPLLDTDIAEAKKLFDVNVWGPLAMVQAFAPLLVAAQGLVSNHTSIASVLPLVWAGMLILWTVERNKTFTDVPKLRSLLSGQIGRAAHLGNHAPRAAAARGARRDGHGWVRRHAHLQ